MVEGLLSFVQILEVFEAVNPSLVLPHQTCPQNATDVGVLRFPENKNMFYECNSCIILLNI